MAEDFDNSPTTQALKYEIGFIDEASEGLDLVQDEFDSTVKAMDGMVDNMDDISDDLSDVSSKYTDAVSDMWNEMLNPPDNIDIPIPDLDPIPLKLEPLELPQEQSDKSTESMMPKMKEMLSSLMDKFKRFSLKLRDILGPITKLAVAFAGVAAIAKIFSPVLKMVAYWLGKVIEPFQFLLYDIMMSVRPIMEKVIEKFWELSDKILPAVTSFIKDSLVPTVRSLIDKWFPKLQKVIMDTINWVVSLVKSFWDWKGKLDVLIPIIGGALIIVLIAAVNAVWGLTAAFLANPMTWVAAAAIALAAAVYQVWKHWSDLKAIILETGMAIQKWFIDKINTAIKLIQKIPFLGEKLGISEIDISSREKNVNKIVRQLRQEPKRDASMLLEKFGLEGIPGLGQQKPEIAVVPSLPIAGSNGNYASSKDFDKLGSRFEKAISKQEKKVNRVTVSDRVRQLGTFRET